nr:IS110 family transposase [Sinorhizobium terangae]
MLAEAFDALQRRDYAALRSLTGVAPVTKRSGKSCIVVRRQACHDRLANAMYPWARLAVQHDLRSRSKYPPFEAEVTATVEPLRSVADRLLAVACAMLKTGTTFDPSLAAQKSGC